MKRIFNIDSGYDCRTECRHEVKGKHGISSDTWTYAVVDEAARAALELQVMTPFFPVTVEVDHVPPSLRKFSGANLSMHFSYPTSKAQVLDRPKTLGCKYIGTCYEAGSWALLADDLVTLNFNQTQGLEQGRGPVVDPHVALRTQSKLWAALESTLAELVKEKQAERANDGDLKWRVCPHCVGQGVMTK